MNTALLACIEYLQPANKRLQDDLDKQKPKYFRLEIIMHNDELVQFYIGFQSYESPSVSNLRIANLSRPSSEQRKWIL